MKFHAGGRPRLLIRLLELRQGGMAPRYGDVVIPSAEALDHAAPAHRSSTVPEGLPGPHTNYDRAFPTTVYPR